MTQLYEKREKERFYHCTLEWALLDARKSPLTPSSPLSSPCFSKFAAAMLQTLSNATVFDTQRPCFEAQNKLVRQFHPCAVPTKHLCSNNFNTAVMHVEIV